MTRGSAGRRAPRARLIVGLIPEALGPMADDMRQALDERRDLIEQRAQSRAEEAIDAHEAWVRRLGDPPTDRRERERWNGELATIAAYRDRYRIASISPLGGAGTTDAQSVDRARALTACRRIASESRPVASAGAGRDGLSI